VQLIRLRASGFRSTGPDPVVVTFEKSTFLLGPNGTGKTAVLHALARMFGSEPSLRRVVPGDFHVPLGESPGTGTARTLWLEADFTFPELADTTGAHPTVPAFFSHMRMEAPGDLPSVRFRLSAHLDENGVVTDDLVTVLTVDADGEPTRTAAVNRYDRASIQVHYLPARRDPADHVSYAANSLLGRLLRASDWQTERTAVTDLSKKISDALAANAGVIDVTARLKEHWKNLHTGTFLEDPALSFLGSEIEGVLRHVTVQFAPGPGEPVVDFSLLSDGQQSLLYVSLALAAHAIGREALSAESSPFDSDKLRPPVFTILAVEEPENSLSPHYLGRVLDALIGMANCNDGQTVVATHSASLMRRVDPDQVRYLRLDAARCTTVARVTMPSETDEAHKFIREALHAYPELYFARVVVLGEGDSEEVVLPRCLAAVELGIDTTAISVVPLGGRHVNHFWRLLHGLGIPHVTLLDLDVGRWQGGWGRIKYAAGELLRYAGAEKTKLTAKLVEDLGSETSDVRDERGLKAVTWLEGHGVFFSSPLDLDLMMLEKYPDAYGVADNEREDPSDAVITAVLGKTGDATGYEDEEKKLFSAYHQRFKLGSKPTHHVGALAALSDAELLAAMPEPLRRLTGRVSEIVAGLPE
jgi:putative ATP-dependent endonuclease of OLD family